MKLFKAMATVASFTILSRIAGMIRDTLTAAYLGAGPLADAFFVALKLPNFFRRIAAEGAFSVSFIPLYSKTIEAEGEDKAADFAGEVCSVMTIILSVFTILMMIAMPYIIYLIAPGFKQGTMRYDVAVTLTQITFPYLMFMSLTSLFGGMLNANSKFGPFAAAPIMFNAAMVAGILIGFYVSPSIAHAMAVAVTVSGILQLMMMVYFVRRHKIKFNFRMPVLSEKVKTLFKLMVPGVIGAGVFQINLFVDMMIASLLPEGSISYMYYADRLNQLPLSIAGIAIGTALLPMLSRALAAGDKRESQNLYNRSIEFCLLIGLPAAAALMIIPQPIVDTLFGHGEFTDRDVYLTATVLMGYGLGLPAYVASKVYMTAFWSQADTVTPVKVAIICAVTNCVLSLILIQTPLGVAGIAASTGIAGWVQIYLLQKNMKSHEVFSFDDRMKRVFPKIVQATLAMALVISVLSFVTKTAFDHGILMKLIALGGICGTGVVTYVLLVHFTGILTWQEAKTYLTRRKGDDKTTVIAPPLSE
jgi:putative peptidoglycan lipid II flippase